MLRPLLALALAPAIAFDACPEGSERVPTSRPERPWVCAWLEGPAEGEDCPAGSTGLTVGSPGRPLRCAVDGADPEPPEDCPKGQRRATDAVGRLRCVGKSPGAAKAANRTRKRAAVSARKSSEAPARPRACPPGTRRVKTENPFEPVRCADAAEEGLPPLQGVAPRSFELPGELRFEHPENWRVTDAWKDDVPTLYVQLDLARDGKPVVMTLSRYRRSGKVYADMDSSLRREREWRGAKDGGKGSVAALPARFLEVPGESKLAYVRVADGYFLLGYSAPEDLFPLYAPAFARLLKSLRIVHAEADPLPEEEP